MIEARVYAKLNERRDGWTTARQLNAITGIPTNCVNHALMRLKKRGAVLRDGDRYHARWQAVPGHKITDGRANNRGRPTGPWVKREPNLVPGLNDTKSVPAKPVFASPLTQALAWEP